MAGPSPGSATQFWTAQSVAAAATQTYELDTGQAYGVIVIVNVDLDASATDGGTLKVYAKTASGGTKAEKPLIDVGLDDDPDGVSFILDPGTYSVELTNDDATYALTTNAWKRLLT